MRLLVLGLVLVAIASLLLVKVGGDVSDAKPGPALAGLDLSAYSDAAPATPINLAFLHHSVGAQLLASPGAEHGTQGVFPTHPNGGGLEALLAANGYRLHEATYGSSLGEHTDLFDWAPKFRSSLADILAIKHQNDRLPDGERNQVVMFKSCFPNNEFAGEGTAPGNPSGPTLTELNARATMLVLRNELAKRPDVLFVYLTAPPISPRTWSEPAWKWMIKRATGRQTHDDDVRRSGQIARRFNNWVKDPAGWLKDYPARNIVVFDFYDMLTDHGRSDFSRYASGDGTDSHPTTVGNSRVAPQLVAFLNRAVRFAGVAQ